jgi:heptosyltransferase-2
MPDDNPDVRRVVIRPPNWLGDAVLALPAIAAVRRHFPSAEVTVAAVPPVAALFREETNAEPDVVVDLPASPREALARLAGGRFEVGVLFPNSFRSAWQLRQAGVGERWGYRRSWRGPLLTRAVRRVRRPASRHQADHYRMLVRGLGLSCGDEAPRVAPSARSVRDAEAIFVARGIPSDRPIVACAPGAAYGQAKQWAPDRMAAVLARVVTDHSATGLVLGAGHDRPAARAIESWLRAHAPGAAHRIVDLVGHTSVRELVGVTARTSVFVSNDSGAMHLAAALGRRVVAIFGPTDERATGPMGSNDVMLEPVFCRPCLLRDCPIDHRCMKRIPVDRVMSVVVDRLESSA